MTTPIEAAGDLLACLDSERAGAGQAATDRAARALRAVLHDAGAPAQAPADVAFMAAIFRFDALSEALAKARADHFGCDADRITFADVGSVNYANAKLAETVDFLAGKQA